MKGARRGRHHLPFLGGKEVVIGLGVGVGEVGFSVVMCVCVFLLLVVNS